MKTESMTSAFPEPDPGAFRLRRFSSRHSAGVARSSCWSWWATRCGLPPHRRAPPPN